MEKFSNQSTGIKVALIGAGATIIVALIGCLGTIFVAFLGLLPNFGGNQESPSPNFGDVTTGGNSPFIVGNDGDVTINNNEPLPEPIVESNLEVGGYTETNICVKQNDVISVNANGGIVVGPSVGSIGPEGTDSGVLGLTLDPFDLIQQYAHGALICQIDTEQKWRECGTQLNFLAEQSGCLVFDINDNEQENNSGEFDVRVAIYENN